MLNVERLTRLSSLCILCAYRTLLNLTHNIAHNVGPHYSRRRALCSPIEGRKGLGAALQIRLE